jgi:hypothetical protein
MARKVPFGERVGAVTPRTAMQITRVDTELRTRLWNAINVSVNVELVRDRIVFEVWRQVRVIRLDSSKRNWSEFSLFFFRCAWHQVYEIIEIVLELWPDAETISEALELGGSGYRLVEHAFVPIVDEQQIAELERALAATSSLVGVRTHLDAALARYADRKEPDYRNSIKESISAVEALACLINGKSDTLGNALKEIEKHFPGTIHPALNGAFNKLYGYTSDSSGIRHALMDGDEAPSDEDARFMLVAVSAFVNYLIAKAMKAGIDL